VLVGVTVLVSVTVLVAVDVGVGGIQQTSAYTAVVRISSDWATLCWTPASIVFRSAHVQATPVAGLIK
jgi:hypothetical protein